MKCRANLACKGHKHTESKPMQERKRDSDKDETIASLKQQKVPPLSTRKGK